MCPQKQHRQKTKSLFVRLSWPAMRMISVFCLTAASTHIALGGESHTAVVDANTIVRKMVATYQEAQTIQENSEVKMTPYAGSGYIQTTSVKFKRPNLLYYTSTDPNLGTYTAFCNGKTVTVFTGRQNIYTKRSSQPNLQQTVSTLSHAGEFLLGAPISQTLSPISFITAKGMPDECKNFHFIREEMLDGVRVAVVSGQADITWLNTLLPIKNATFEQQDVTLWIDTSRKLLVKAGFNVRWRVDVPATKKTPPGAARSGLRFIERHRNIVLNVPLRDEEFFFVPPAGSAEKFQDSK